MLFLPMKSHQIFGFRNACLAAIAMEENKWGELDKASGVLDSSGGFAGEVGRRE